jgi:putative DNA primase/helicase
MAEPVDIAEPKAEWPGDAELDAAMDLESQAELEAKQGANRLAGHRQDLRRGHRTVTAVHRVLDALVAAGSTPRRSGSGWMARCPAHDDSTASLSITNGDGRVLLHDHAGCDYRDIVAALKLTEGDLFDEPKSPSSKPRIVATYDYVDEQGTLLYQVVRLSPKSFRQRRPDGSGGWIWNLQGTRRVLYRLPKVIEAVKNGETVYVCEGEKDVHAVEAAGAVATCNPGGAGKWRAVYNETLTGADVVIVADRDNAGYGHARTVATELHKASSTWRVVEPIDGKDAADHLGAGRSLDDFADSAGGLSEEHRPPTAETGLEFPDGHRATDVGNAARLLDQAGGRLRYVHAWGKWIVYQRGRWTLDENDALVTEQGKRVAKSLFALAAKTTDKDERKAIWGWAIRSEASGSIAAMVRLARGIPGVLVEHEELDADPYLLNVRNGTIDLRTGQLRPHDPADLITVQCPVSYNPNATAPLWEKCVERWQPDPEVCDYIQVRAGAGATGKPTETVDVDYGSGSNGKSKFWGAIQHVLGDYAVVPHKSLLVTQKHEQHDTVKARLFRKRLAVASETKAADTLDDEQVKNLTGGDRLQGRRMREDPWEFNPTHTLVMFSNHKPAVQGRDEGIWRRLRLVPWAVTIPEDERDDDLAGKLRAEAPGILRWLVDGARRFIDDGLTPPAAVRAATDAYRSDEDVVGRFIGQVLHFSAGWAWSADIRTELEAWCADQGVAPEPSMNDVTVVLKENGCSSVRLSVRGRRGVIWRGVTIVDHTASDQGER